MYVHTSLGNRMQKRILIQTILLIVAVVVGSDTAARDQASRTSGTLPLDQGLAPSTDTGQDGFVLRFTPGFAMDQPVDLQKVKQLDEDQSSTRLQMQALKDWTELNVNPFALFSHRLYWGGPVHQPEYQYLEVAADNEYYAFAKPLYASDKGRTRIDPNQLPILRITWMVDQFADGADLYHYYKVDRAIGVIITFGEAIPSNIPRYHVPRGFAFVWAGPEGNEQLGDVLSCQTSLEVPHKKLFCYVPQVKYVVVRKGGAGTIARDHINLVDLYARYFPDHYRRRGGVPPVAAITIEAKTTEPMANGTQSRARLYDISFLPPS